MKRAAALLVLALMLVSGLPLASVAQSSGGNILIKNGTVMTAVKGTHENTDILVKNGKIAGIGKGLTAPAGTTVIDATDKWVTPGIIDCHSHSMLDSINEGAFSVTSMVRTRDMLNPTDIA